jgi:hypothetical protein
MNDARLWHPWLRINRVLRVMLHERWSAEAWAQVRGEFKKALALRSEIRRAGWFADQQRRRLPVLVLRPSAAHGRFAERICRGRWAYCL